MNTSLVTNYSDFWKWFSLNENDFFQILKEGKNIEGLFFEQLSEKLSNIRDGFNYLSGMIDKSKAELVITADGNIKNVVFVEEFVASAPDLERWKFTALKQPTNNLDFVIQIGDYQFGADTISFVENNSADYPDEIDISIVYKDLTEENKNDIINGIHIFLDNYLGELNFLTKIDSINVVGNANGKEEIPLEKLKDYLIWREKEFIEKYAEDEYISETDDYMMLEGTTASGETSFAVINTKALNWDSQASHPWVGTIRFIYDGSETNGMPNEEDYDLLDEIEENTLDNLFDSGGTIYIGRETAEGVRTMHFVNKNFREMSKILDKIESEYKDAFAIETEIYKDKYWKSFEHFRVN